MALGFRDVVIGGGILGSEEGSWCFFVKQKTAYEIDCDWSSDVCSSDLPQDAKDVHSYWLEDVDLNGTRTSHGPVSPGPNPGNSNLSPAKMITEVNILSVGPQPVTPTECVGEALSSSSNRSVRHVQFELASKPAVKILVYHDGRYRSTQPGLAAEGL